MDALAPSFSIQVDLDRDEVHFAASGLWDMPKMIEFQRDLLEKTKPLLERQASIMTLGDLRGLVPQTREVADAIRVVIVESQKLGVVKTAIVSDNLLAKMQYSRLNEGINAEMFDNKADALHWLRS
jgi:hypothetical protein